MCLINSYFRVFKYHHLQFIFWYVSIILMAPAVVLLLMIYQMVTDLKKTWEISKML